MCSKIEGCARWTARTIDLCVVAWLDGGLAVVSQAFAFVSAAWKIAQRWRWSHIFWILCLTVQSLLSEQTLLGSAAFVKSKEWKWKRSAI